jgi:Flp pilus assembly protein TadD
MRLFSLALLLCLACCANPDRRSRLSEMVPGLDVADVALAQGAPDTALHIAERRLAVKPDDAQALLRAGQAQAALGRREEAARSFSRALAIDPTNQDAVLGLGRLRLATDPAAAAKLFQRVLEQNPQNVASLNDLGIAQDLLGRHAEAQQDYRRVLAVQPGQTAALVNLGLSLALSGRPRDALQILQPLAASPATPPRVRQDLAVALALSGNDAAAATILGASFGRQEVASTLAGYHMLQAGS